MADRNEIESDTDRSKRLAAEAAIAEVADGMAVGLGTGSTAAYAIAALGRRIAAGLRVTVAATSLATERAAAAAGIAVTPFDGLARLDLAIDGADEVDPGFRAIKGAGGALLREKVVAQAAARMICIVDPSKRVAALGGRPVPLETLPFAGAFVAARAAGLGAEPVVRRDAAGTPVRSDQGNLLIDCRFAAIADPERLGAQLSAIPGVLGHGLFLSEISALYVGETIRLERPREAA